MPYNYSYLRNGWLQVGSGWPLVTWVCRRVSASTGTTTSIPIFLKMGKIKEPFHKMLDLYFLAHYSFNFLDLFSSLDSCLYFRENKIGIEKDIQIGKFCAYFGNAISFLRDLIIRQTYEISVGKIFDAKNVKFFQLICTVTKKFL